MIWLEMARDETHGGGSWGFGHALWAPTIKQNGSRWPYWTNVSLVKSGDVVIHLRGKEHNSYFVGYSIAADNGGTTTERPPSPGDWAYATRFFRVPLKDYTAFEAHLKLDDLFRSKERDLRLYYRNNKARPRGQKLTIFYVIQSDVLRCQNGAYLSVVDDELAALILGTDFSDQKNSTLPAGSTNTGTSTALLQLRVGQNKFSQNVRDNYQHRCCFPGCEVNEDRFLVGSHIARWADAPDLRGETANGLCLCLMHDKAFEIGLFTLTDDFHVTINYSHPILGTMPWFDENLKQFDKQCLRLGPILPDKNAIEFHHQRIRKLLFSAQS